MERCFRWMLWGAVFLMSGSARADGENAMARQCGKWIDTRPAKSCTVRVCQKALLCDFNCAERHPEAEKAPEFKNCRSECWDLAVKEMTVCQ